MKRLKIFVVVLFLTLTTCLFSGCVAKVLMPSVKEARFDFSVTYEVNGEEITYTGVYVCKFDGVYASFVGGGIDWTGYVENVEGDAEIAVQTNEDGIVYIGFGFYPEYSMVDPDYIGYSVPEPTLYIIYHSDDPDMVCIDSDIDFMEKYGIRLISYSYAEPIENEYKEKLAFGRFDFSIN